MACKPHSGQVYGWYWAALKNEPQSLSSERNRGHPMISYTLLCNHNCLLLFRPLASVSIKTQWPSLPLLEDFSTSLWLSPHIVLLFFTSFHFLSTPKELASLGLCRSPLPFPSLPYRISKDFFTPSLAVKVSQIWTCSSAISPGSRSVWH